MKRLSILILCVPPMLLICSCMTADLTGATAAEKIELYTLTNKAGTVVKITNYGARITSISVPDRAGKHADIALGYAKPESYMTAVSKPYFGATIGRYANRIAQGTFGLDSTTYSLATNNGPNHLHGGTIGFDKVLWHASPVHSDVFDGLRLTYFAKDGEEGYPGNLQCAVVYKLTDANELMIEYEATTDQATPINLTNHTYFNLAGEGSGPILDHRLRIYADHFTPVDKTLIPTGIIAPVAGTPLDFTAEKSIGRDIDQENQQLQFGSGYDHNFVLNKQGKPGSMTLAATVYEPNSGRFMEVLTEEPALQFYSGNFLDGRLTGKSGRPYGRRSGFCLETQHYPDSPNQPQFSSTILRPGETYNTRTMYRFSVKGSITDRVLVCSHRANYGDAPENSLAGIKACIEGGVDMIEIDVAQTKDGKLVLMHDKTVDRTTNGSGRIEEMNWAEVKKLRLRKRGKKKELTEETVPALEEALNLCKDKIHVNLDMKGASIFDCAEVAKKTGTEDLLMYRASSLNWLKRVSARYPGIHISPRFDFRKKDVNWPGEGTGLTFCEPYLEAIDIWGVDIPFASLSHPAVSRENLVALNKRNVRAWALTLNIVSYGGFRDRDALKDPAAVWGTLIDRGISVIMTDESEALIKYLKSINRH